MKQREKCMAVILPRTIGERYQMLKRLGRGGFATVYYGHDLETKQEIAVKSYISEMIQSDPMLVERFEREGEVLRSLKHPNIVSMLAFVKEEEEQFIVMEYVPGGTLRDLMDAQPHLPLRAFVHVVRPLCDALIRAHELNVIHRDIKPANVLLAEDATPRLTDFGLARIQDQTRITHKTSMMGTYAYMSPEVCTNKDADERADVWSLGVMFYEMLGGKLPFDDSNTQTLLFSILKREPQPLSELRPDLPFGVFQLIDAMLEKDPDDRTSTMYQVMSALELLR
jgi:serine/threonine protein kinase